MKKYLSIGLISIFVLVGVAFAKNTNALEAVSNCLTSCPTIHFTWQTSETDVAGHYIYSDKVVDTEGHWETNWSNNGCSGGPSATCQEQQVWDGTYTDSSRPYEMICPSGYAPNGSNCRKGTPGHYQYTDKIKQFNACPAGSEIKPTDSTKCRTQDMKTEHRHWIDTTYTCPATYQLNPGHNNCRKWIDTTYTTTNHSADVAYIKDDNKCHRPSDNTLEHTYGMNHDARDSFKHDNSEWVNPILTAPAGYYLDENICYPQTPVCTNSEATNYDNSVDNTEIADNSVCIFPPAPTTGSIEITKYECPADTIVTRSANGVGQTVPQGCVLQDGKKFGYVHGAQTDANGPYPELNSTFTLGGSTNSSGILTISDLAPAGRYLIAELNSDNQQLPAGDILGLYCEGDGDTSNNNDNQELTFIPAAGQTAHCVAYNKMIEVTPVDVCPNIDDIQEKVPDGMEKNSEGNCVDIPQCNEDATQVLVSDTSTLVDEHAAVAVTPNLAWTTLIDGATWIYNEVLSDVGSSPTGDKTFTKTFTITGAPIDSSLEIAADNMYSVSVNGNLVSTGASATTLDNFSAPATWTIPAADLLTGSNTITFTVTNPAVDPNNSEVSFGDPNPAGLLYKLTVHENDCPITPPTPTTCTEWTYSDWGTCSVDGLQTRTITSSSPDSCQGGEPLPLTQSCTYTPPQIDVCPNIDDIQTEVPQGYHLSGENCVRNRTAPRNGGSACPSGSTFNFQLNACVPNGQVLGASTGPGQVLGAETCSLNRTMRFGMKGCDVLELHNKLTTLGFYKGPIDDKFGRLLLPAVKAFQKANPPLKADGVVGPATKALLNK